MWSEKDRPKEYKAHDKLTNWGWMVPLIDTINDPELLLLVVKALEAATRYAKNRMERMQRRKAA